MRWFLVRTTSGWDPRELVAPFGKPLFFRGKYQGPFNTREHAVAGIATMGRR